eukprot:COSAG05_NODE_4902_length_1332_cov_1.386050_2_plen_80_part_00
MEQKQEAPPEETVPPDAAAVEAADADDDGGRISEGVPPVNPKILLDEANDTDDACVPAAHLPSTPAWWNDVAAMMLANA